MEPETGKLTVWLVLIYNLFNCLAFPFADPPSGERNACGGECKIYNGMVDYDDHWREACIFCPVCICIPHGYDRNRTGDVPGLVHTGSHILYPLQK